MTSFGQYSDIGGRNTKKALLMGLLQPRARLKDTEDAGGHAGRLALHEDAKSLPRGAVWTEFCARHEVADDGAWLPAVKIYERDVLSRRN